MKNGLYLSIVLVVVVLCVALLMGYGQGGSAVRQTWEHKSIVIITPARSDWTWAEEGKDLPGAPNMIVKSKELGEQGWELVSVTSTSWIYDANHNGRTSHLTYWFKRLK